ncbi:hypothetical protein STASHLEY_00810 [Brevundimonas phage vB_BpoS-StAshley]|nr:hypothetical protein STASHLEY_00810 [Brevundimonas phage vB_BpoS-StAshley]
MAIEEKFVMVWSSYNEWRSTRPFNTLKEVLKHKEGFIKDNEHFNRDYNKNIQIIPIQVEVR